MKKYNKELKYFRHPLLHTGMDSVKSNSLQTLLIHASLLNADYLDELSGMIKMHGYNFVSQGEALKDEAYKEQISIYSKRGLSWIFRWGLSKGKSDRFMNNDIDVPLVIIELAKN